ncbi:MAG: response regulator, partial [Nitrosopumilaceae archaeon]|nr:response regulator [Nitrosopumilaceae archaeon]NIU01809.1 response regulator [Nitrosopumilaceae archaeon]NIU88217.1 response regulator [Nitrosopumilaceae archaeon]NIV66530.1 response regulator [Nitrosopumilaceae archaeon]NIX62411.1 response regulator [Nitrosopumilaceae archaeon]
LMDSEMPEVGGMESFEKIKAFDSNAKVVMITGYSDNDKRFENALKNGLKDIITKPVGLNQILELVKKHL